MDIPKILPDLGSSVSTALLNLEELATASVGEMMHAATLLTRVVSERMADPATYNELATFNDAAGTDWSGLQSTGTTSVAANGAATATLEKPIQTARDLDEPVSAPLEPENYCDTLPGLGNMLSQLLRFQDSALANYSRYLEASMSDQRRYLGTPRKIRDFRDVADYLTSTMRISRHQARKVIRRGRYYAHRPGLHAEEPSAQPIFQDLAKSMAKGKLPIENADKIIDLDEDLTKYSNKTRQPLERKDQVLEVFEPTMVETAESSTPDELSNVKKRWIEEIAHWISPDGPSPAQAFAKEADNALRCREQADGSSVFSMHASPAVSARFKNWMLQQLDFHGTPARISDDALKLLDLLNYSPNPGAREHGASDIDPQEPASSTQQRSDASSEATPHDENTAAEEHSATVSLEDLGPMTSWDTSLDPTLVVAEAEDGTPLTVQELNHIETLTTGQRMGSILLSHLLTMLSLDPIDLGGKKAHGISAQLMIVQDIETAYHALGFGSIPEPARRPSGPDGYLPPVIKRPNPQTPGEPDCLDNPCQCNQHIPPDSGNSSETKPVPWTAFQSEAVNIGSIHPADADILLCNAEITGQIWNGPDQILKQKRALRLFTAVQRRAILARDKGCQAPGCTVPGTYCDIHHIKAWSNGGPTDEDNGIALCPFHHDSVHHGRWTIRKHKSLTFFQPPPWIDPDQPLLRNAYWNT